MKDIYLIQKKCNPFKIDKTHIYLDDIYEIFPSKHKSIVGNILVRKYDKHELKYDVVHLGEIIDKINKKTQEYNITFLKPDDVIIYFDNNKKDRTKYIRVFTISVIVLMGSIMGIMNFHADVNMLQSQTNMVSALTRNPNKYLPYFQIPYTIGIGIGVALFFNKFIPTYSKDEPSPLELKMISLNKEIENQIRKR